MAAKESSLSKLPLPGKIAVGAVLMLLILGGYWLVFYSDTSNKITSATSQQKQLNNDLAAQRVALVDYFKDKDELTLRQQKQKDQNKALPTETEVATFLSSLQQMSNVAGVDLKGWQPQEEKTEAFYARVPMKLELSGRFQQITKFAYELGRVDRIINLENIELSDPKIEGDEVHLKLKCLATTFHSLAPAAKTFTPPGTPGAPGTPGTPAAPAPSTSAGKK